MNDIAHDSQGIALKKHQSMSELIAGVHRYRAQLYQQGLDIAQEYTSRRAELASGHFCNLNLMVRARNNGRSVQMVWVLMHFRGGKRTGATNVPKPRTTQDFDLSTLKRSSPEWMHELVVQSELKLRPIREHLSRLTVIEREMRLIAEQSGEDLSALYGASSSDTDSEADDLNPFPEA